ncbi:MAG TPA: VOC family protein [Rhizomicrobium sp.]|jgi:catechol 2,3-dioxygenase-like lactoylglutathione lyase family enzyme|nr:VOC family protein [Rhizomicrobium sp.]
MTSLRHAGIVVSDLDRALYFYCDLLGLTLARRMQESGPFVSSILGMENVEVETAKLAGEDGSQLELLAFIQPVADLAPPPSLIRRGPTHIALTVRNLDSLYARMAAQGVNFTTAPRVSVDGGAKVTFCRDPDGTYLELVEPLSKKP